jgi:hypothetical protein
MKSVRNIVVVALLAATPLAFANFEGPGNAAGGCQGMQSSTEGAQQGHAQRHARVAVMHQGMQSGGMRYGEGQGHRHGQAQTDENPKK